MRTCCTVRPALLLAWVWLGAAGCEQPGGELAGPLSDTPADGLQGWEHSPDASGPPGSPGLQGSDGAPGTGCNRPLPKARAVWMDARQYRNALHDLVGYEGEEGPELPPGLETDLDVLDRPWVTTGVLDRVMRDAEAAAESLRGRTATFLGCSDLGDADCVREGLATLATRAFVREPEPAELDALMALRAEALALLPEQDPESAALVAVHAILAAPSTLYRAEFASPDEAGRRSLTAHERAEGIAAFLLDSVPDEELLAAAEDGSLLTDAGVRAQVTRLLDLPRVQRHLTGLLLNGFRATRVFESPKDDVLFPEFTPTLQQNMFEESRRFVEDVIFTRNAPVSELLLGDTTFLDRELAELYGVTPPSTRAGQDLVPATVPEGRAGLLTQASVMSGLARTDKTSVVARGLFVRRDLLCLPKIPGPPDSVQSQIEDQLTQDATEVELAEYRAQTQPCSGCHAQFDRFGLALEGFDPIGRARAEMPEPIDLAGLGPLSGVVETPVDLVQVLVEDDRFTHCLAERLMDYALTTLAAGNAACEGDPLHEAVDAGDGTLASILQAIVTHPAFSTRREEQP